MIDLIVRIQNDRPAPAVEEEPAVQLTVWRMVRAETGERYLVAILSSGAVRTTSALKSIDPVTRNATTSSGRQYELLCGPTDESIARLKIAAAVVHAGLQTSVDVSEEVWAQIAASTH